MFLILKSVHQRKGGNYTDIFGNRNMKQMNRTKGEKKVFDVRKSVI